MLEVHIGTLLIVGIPMLTLSAGLIVYIWRSTNKAMVEKIKTVNKRFEDEGKRVDSIDTRMNDLEKYEKARDTFCNNRFTDCVNIHKKLESELKQVITQESHITEKIDGLGDIGEKSTQLYILKQITPIEKTLERFAEQMKQVVSNLKSIQRDIDE